MHGKWQDEGKTCCTMDIYSWKTSGIKQTALKMKNMTYWHLPCKGNDKHILSYFLIWKRIKFLGIIVCEKGKEVFGLHGKMA